MTTPQEPTAQEELRQQLESLYAEESAIEGVSYPRSLINSVIAIASQKIEAETTHRKQLITAIAEDEKPFSYKLADSKELHNDAYVSYRERAAEERAKQELREKFCIDPNKQYDVKAGNGVVVIQER